MSRASRELMAESGDLPIRRKNKMLVPHDAIAGDQYPSNPDREPGILDACAS